MAEIVQHKLKAKNIAALLRESGAITERILHGNRNREVHVTALDVKICCEEEWQKEEEYLIAKGVLDFAKKTPDGQSGVRRDLTVTEVEELKYWPIGFDDEDTVLWVCCWTYNDAPAFYVSKLFPNIRFAYSVYYGRGHEEQFVVENGSFIANN